MTLAQNAAEAMIESIITTVAPGLSLAIDHMAKEGRDPKTFVFVISRPPGDLVTKQGQAALMIIDAPIEEVADLAAKVEAQIPASKMPKVPPTKLWENARERETTPTTYLLVIAIDQMFAVAGVEGSELKRIAAQTNAARGKAAYGVIDTPMGQMLSMTVPSSLTSNIEVPTVKMPSTNTDTFSLAEAANAGVTQLTRKGWTHNQYVEIKISKGLVEPKADVVVLDENGLVVSRDTVMTLTLAADGYVPWTAAT